MTYSNAQILAAVVSYWARPAITQLAMSRVSRLPLVQSLQTMAVESGLVNSTYNIGNDLQFLVSPAINNVMQPYLERQFSQIPDEAIPGLVRDIVAEAESKGSYTMLDGIITLDKDDIAELKQLIEKNMPIPDNKGYEVITN